MGDLAQLRLVQRLRLAIAAGLGHVEGVLAIARRSRASDLLRLSAWW